MDEQANVWENARPSYWAVEVAGCHSDSVRGPGTYAWLQIPTLSLIYEILNGCLKLFGVSQISHAPDTIVFVGGIRIT